MFFFFFFQAEDGIRDSSVTGVQTCALPISMDIVQGVALTTILWQLFYLRLSHIKENHRRAAETGHKARARPPGWHHVLRSRSPAGGFGPDGKDSAPIAKLQNGLVGDRADRG